MHITRVEFVVTNACTGRCKHCSKEDTIGGHVEYAKLAGWLTDLAKEQPLDSVMCFGGEPLLFPDDVCGIMSEAARAHIPMRQIITNGYFSSDFVRITEVASALAAAGVTDILLSVDAFHQESIPVEPVYLFAEAVRGHSNLKLHPAWLQGAQAENPWDVRTHEILELFAPLGLPVTKGNVIFPAGRAREYLAEYFQDDVEYHNPYDHQPDRLSVGPNGDIALCGQMIGNAYRSA